MDLDELKNLIALMNDNDLIEVEVVDESGKKIRLRKGADDPSAKMVTVLPAVPGGVPVAPPVDASGAAPEVDPNLGEILSPMVGTFYRSPSPDSDSYVEVGHTVGDESVVCIIEAMKVMNEIKAETEGVIAEILVENGDPVEFNQPLFRVRPAT